MEVVEAISRNDRTVLSSDQGDLGDRFVGMNAPGWPYSVCRRCSLLLAGSYRSGTDLHLLVDVPDNGGPGSTHFVVEARLQRLTEGPNQCRTQRVIVLFLHSVSHMVLS